LWKILDDDYIRTSMTHVLLYANKQDLPGALKPQEVMEARDVYYYGGEYNNVNEKLLFNNYATNSLEIIQYQYTTILNR